MKMFFLMSDTTVVVIALIPGLFGILTLIVQATINARVKRVEAMQKIRIAKTDESIEKIDKISEKQDKNIEQMDGHMTKLLETTAELNKKVGYTERKEEQIPIIEKKVKDAEELGKLKGKEEIREEIKKQNGGNKDEPLPVIVTNVVETKVQETSLLEQQIKQAEEISKLKAKEELRTEIKKNNGGDDSPPAPVVVVKNLDK